MTDGLLAMMFFVAALLYSSVGHAGASGYLAAMSLMGFAPSVMKPTALILNILVASIATLRFARAGSFSWSVCWPFALASVPMAWLGGRLTLPDAAFKPLVGLVLLWAAWRMVTPFQTRAADAPVRRPSLWVSLPIGGGLGLLSGLTGTGGGIFLSPLLILCGWAELRTAAGVSAAFILLNSIAGLLGNLPSVESLPRALPVWLMCVTGGALLGTSLGTRRFSAHGLRVALALVLVIAAMKLIGAALPALRS